ncbi:MAG: hypothetical protein WC233_03525 [Sphaerochaeta sp.]
MTTTGWDGLYRWVNETKKDNKGKARQLDFRVTSTKDSYRVEGLYGQWHTIFPLVPASEIGKTFTFDGERAVQQAYRENAQTFNTSKMRPDTWSVTSIWHEGNSMGVDVRSRAKGINVSTYSTFTFLLNESRGPMLYFETSADGIAALSIFRSPNSGDDGIFKAKLISSQI